jgi:hypothetical protein
MQSVGATGFEPTTSRTRSKRSFLNYCTLVEELNVARRSEAQTTAAGYLPASPMYASHFDTTSYNTKSGGGGNCTRVPGSISGASTCDGDDL